MQPNQLVSVICLQATSDTPLLLESFSAFSVFLTVWQGFISSSNAAGRHKWVSTSGPDLYRLASEPTVKSRCYRRRERRRW